MNNIKSVFSIKDLENLSGIKAHTIRIWEKRYSVLEPMRTDTNIRYYDAAALQKLLNISLLHRHGYKISKISRMPATRIPELAAEIISQKTTGVHAVNAFKMAMMDFDQSLFYHTYDRLLAEKPFHEVFYQAVIPLMEEIGLLWQTGTISPAHEHFISHLVRQKIMAETETLLRTATRTGSETFVLFLPEGEVHEIGLLYLNYELIRAGHKTVFLGAHVPSEHLFEVSRFTENPIYISYFTVAPQVEKIGDYVRQLAQRMKASGSRAWLLGRNTAHIDPAALPAGITLFDSIQNLLREV